MRLLRLLNEPAGQEFLAKIGIKDELMKKLPYLGISGISNALSAIKYAKYFELTEKDVVFTIFTDSVELYYSRLAEMTESLGKIFSSAGRNRLELLHAQPINR